MACMLVGQASCSDRVPGAQVSPMAYTNTDTDNAEAALSRASLAYTEAPSDWHLRPVDTLPEEYLLQREVPPSATVPALAAFIVAAVYLLLLLIAAHLPAPSGGAAAVVSVLVFTYLPLAVVYHGVRIPLTAGGEVLAGLICLGIWLALVGLETESDVVLIGPARSVALLSWSLFFGMLASRVMRDRNILVPACVVAAAADLLSVGWGFTGRALRETPALVAKLSVAVPELAPHAASGRGAAFPVLATMGVGDLFFVALFFAAAARFGLPLRRTFCFVFPLMATAMLLTVHNVLPWMGIPGLPFIAAGLLAANVRNFRFSREEWRALGVVGLALAVLGLALFVVWRVRL